MYYYTTLDLLQIQYNKYTPCRNTVMATGYSLQDIPQRVCVSLEQDKNYEHSGSQCPIHHPGVDGDTKPGGAGQHHLLIQQFSAIHFANHLVLPVVCDRESFLVVCECRDSDQS